ncbi:alcohol dehydrogenase (cytochrome c)/quinohemoprotein ethanol dehydrogenase [Altererythrobacter atlanticus]|uniref:Quinohemoprotein alcohol dehydrogenase ADH IIB n=1 Tax=Croceibacterium atlanticum TaxID=1267766 RepID=A0A0F7KUV6_9SPHN|nr:PQQ-dependent dehydrogenase, methanol/ethanol family [Croceibacterium atlanticum]AKH42956.1 Quinohemoprotein alcohol dehydrogenase ADH IIB precursor [Croceibacterium atlanticum]MBB5734087.1 alcohol dehydrogenase (cytochrome c)/quinohemoprotein ethanol dehydrogenase [Croceibacterium atlanticum]
MKKAGLILAGALALGLAGCNGDAQGSSKDGVTGALITAADGKEWLTYGRDYSEQRYSPLTGIGTGNVADLGLAWFADLDTARGQEATPLVIDGKIFTSTAWSKVKAYDARSGELLWDYDPEVPGEWGAYGCCDVVNRGLAAWGDKLFLGTFDGRLVALDRDTGEVAWSRETTDRTKPYTITGAPRVIDGKVLIGNGGAEYGVRGYITAYDANSGDQLWRFYTVPGDPQEEAAEPDYLAKARETWNGEFWKLGGGGTVWDAMAYDPDLDLLYIGVGNGSPWNQSYRSPGGGDNLYLSSIVALKPETGEYVWHYQTTPGETWDFTATQHIMLADLEMDGQQRKVLMQAPKNGYFYVIDRETGELISANNYVPQNWTTGIDMATGRPIENPEARYDKTGKPFVSMPGAGGGHSWHPMAFNPVEGLVYIPAIEAGFPYVPEKDWKPDTARGFNVGVDMGAGAMPPDAAIRQATADSTKGALIAWDPVKQEERWRVQYPGPWNGGLLATAGGLLFQGTAAGNFVAYDAHDGKELWSFPAQTGIVAPPITYELDGEQYVAVLAGWGGIWTLAPGGILSERSGPVRNISRLLVFKLGANGELPPAPPLDRMPLDPPPFRGTKEQVTLGGYNYGRYCGQCHGDAAIGSTVLPDLRRSAVLDNADSWQMIVHDGALADNGMASFAPSIGKEKIEAIRQYVIFRANEDKKLGGLGS